ncbi:ATP-binding cassette sub-family B member 9 isoform X2 [Heterodontus francisci]|uniref:ATP-binding cassette sub-family B member 9 isoform X2 n=1 Tax=Heterodontus francisci TaxID=7792 RepID=UPI00355C2716
MKAWQVFTYSIVVQLLDALVTTHLYTHGLNYRQFRSDAMNFDIFHSLLDLWATCLLRIILLAGASLGVCINRIDGPKRLKSAKLCILIFCIMISAYAIIKVLLYSETEKFANDPWFWCLTAWTFISLIATYHVVHQFSCLKTSPTVTVSLEATSYEDQENSMSNAGQKRPEKAKENSNSISTMWRLLTYSKENAALMAGAHVSVLISSLGDSFTPYFLGNILDGIAQNDISRFTGDLIAMALFGFASTIAAGFREGLFNLAFAKLNIQIRYKLFSSIMQQEISFFDSHQTGEITSRLTSDATVVSDILSQNVSLFLRNLTRAFGAFIFMIILSWRVSMLGIIGFTFLFIFLTYFGKYYKRLAKQVQDALANANNIAEETISSIRTVHSFANERTEAHTYNEQLKTMYSLNKKQILSLTIFTWGNKNLTNIYSGLIQGIGVTEKIFDYIDNKPTWNKIGTFTPENLKGEITFRNVTFAYPTSPQNKILNNVSFTIYPGEITALVGISGSGKSSCVQLLENFYQPQAGEVLLDDRPVQDYDHKYLHCKVAAVGQEPVLFARSIRENILYGLQECSLDSVVQASQKANAHEFITELKNGYDTETGEKGAQLSGGQKQRVAIARALVRAPRVLLLDEATSALDGESEYYILQELNKLKDDCTILIVAHRLSTVKNAQKIIVLNRGMMAEEGNYKELMQRKGLFFRMVLMQTPGSEFDNNSFTALNHSK